MATRPELFSEDVSIELEEEDDAGDEDEGEDVAFGLSREDVSESVPDVDVEGCC